MIARINDLELYYERSGCGEAGRPLLMLHGNGEDHTIFDKALPELTDRFDCYLIDSRGHGKSTPVDEFHYEEMAADMVGFMELLDLTDVVFYGFSDGGIIGLLAAGMSDRISELIISGANTSPAGLKRRLLLEFRLKYLFHKEALTRLMLKEPNINDSYLKGIQARTLVLAGSKDLIRLHHTRHIADSIPRAELRILEGEDHGSYIVHDSRIGNIIREWVAEEKD